MNFAEEHVSWFKDKDTGSNLMKCHRINNKTERNPEKQTFQSFQVTFITTMAGPALSSRREVFDTTENSRSGI
jgi:hypothetical protein